MSAGVPQAFSFVLTGTACPLPEGALSAQPLLTTPSGTRVPVEVTRLIQVGGTVELEVALPALAAGTHFLQVFVEPTLGVVQLPVFVGTDRQGDAGFLLRFPEPCVRPARTTTGTQFCATRDGGFLASRDGQSVTLTGVERLLTVGNVAWAIGRSDIRRYEDQPDAGLVLTATATLLLAGAGSSADELSAIVGPSRYDFDAGTLERRDHGLSSGAHWSEGPRVLSVTPGSICEVTARPGDQSRCVVNGDDARFLGLDSSYLWLVDRGTTPLAPFGEFTSISLVKRPVVTDAGVALTVPLPPGLQPAQTEVIELAGGFPPILLTSPDAGPRRIVLLTQRRDGTSFDLLPSDLVGASRDFLFLLGTTARELRVVPLPLTP
jgi:hypothetical protein